MRALAARSTPGRCRAARRYRRPGSGRRRSRPRRSAMLLTSPPAEKPTNTWSTLVPAIRSACSTASRIAISLFSMSAMKPRLTPRLSRWPVPRMLAACPSSPGSAISAQTLDEPTSSAATRFRRGRLGGAAHHQIVRARSLRRPARDRARGGDVGDACAGLARDADIDRAADRACRSGRSRGRAAGSCWSMPGEAGERAARLLLAFGQAEHLAALEAHVPAAAADPGRAGRSAACSRGAASSKALELGDMAVGGGADQQRQIGHRLEPHRLEHDAVGVDQAQPLVVLPDRRRPPLDRCRRPACRAAGATPAPRGSSRTGAAAARVAVEIDQRHRHRMLVEGDVVDVERARRGRLPRDLDPPQREAGLADRPRRARAPASCGRRKATIAATTTAMVMPTSVQLPIRRAGAGRDAERFEQALLAAACARAGRRAAAAAPCAPAPRAAPPPLRSSRS